MKNTSPKEIKWSLIREDFPALSKGVYLDSAAWGLANQRVSNTLKQYLDFTTDYGILSKEHLDFWESGRLSDDTKEKYPALTSWQGVEAVRKECASTLGVKKADTISWHMNTTEAFETVARMVKWREGDELITTNLDHESIINVCEMLRTIRGVEIKRADARGILPTSDFESRLINRISGKITDRTKMIVFSHVFFCCGQTIEPKKIISALRQNSPTGTLIVLDGAHALGQIPIELDAYACDAYITSGSKWLLAPAGSGILYVSSAASDYYQYIIWPLHMYENASQRSQSVKKKSSGETELIGREIIRGATPQLPLIGLHAALKEYRNLTPSVISGRIHELSKIACSILSTMSSLNIDCCEKVPTGMLFLRNNDWDATDVVRIYNSLKGKKVCVSAIENPPSLRVSVHYYNDEDEFKQLVRYLFAEGIT